MTCMARVERARRLPMAKDNLKVERIPAVSFKTFIGWVWRCAVWITLLSPLSIIVARDYRRVIGEVLAQASTWWGYPLELVHVGVGMPNDGLIFSNQRSWIQTAFYSPADLGFFAAMCLATLTVDRKTRTKTILLGAALLVVAQLVLLSCCLASMLLDATDGALRFQTQLTWTRIMGTAPWVGPIAAWVLLLGRWEMGGHLPHTLKQKSTALGLVAYSARRLRSSLQQSGERARS